MKKSWEPVKVKVLTGYFLLVGIVAFAVWIIYTEILPFYKNQHESDLLNSKILSVNALLANLYQAEALERNYALTGNWEHYMNYARLMDTIYFQIDSLTRLSTNPFQNIHSDSIRNLLDKKRVNLRELVAIKKTGSSKDLYERAMNRITYSSDSIAYFLSLYKTVTDNRDSTYVQQKRKKFFKRLIYAFAPQENSDSALQVNTHHSVQIDSIINNFSPADSVTQLLAVIMQDIHKESLKIEQQLAEKERDVLANNRTISQQLHQMLSIFENDAFENSYKELYAIQAKNRQTTWIMVSLGILAFLIIIVFLILILKDISRSQHYRLELERARAYSDSLLKSKERFMLSITHDIKSPLASVIGYARLMNNDVEQKKRDFYLESINKSGEQIMRLINGLVDLIRLESGKFKIERTPFNLKTLVNELVAGFGPIASSKGLNLRLEFNASATADYLGDTVRLKQVLGNLISNALKFTEKGEVLIRVSLIESIKSGDIISFDVIDTGPGISESDSRIIFDEFSQIAGKQGKRYEGAGLGLTISRHLVALLHGTIGLESKIGVGSHFTVQLPLERCNRSLSLVKESIISGPAFNLENKSVLLIDDDEAFLKLLTEVLQQARMKVNHCNHPSKVLPALEFNPVDLIITDIRMPTMTGISLLAHIQWKTGGQIPVIALTGEQSSETIDYSGLGFAASLNKPFLPEELLETIHNVLLRKSQNGIKRHALNSYHKNNGTPENSYSLNQIRRFAADDPKSLNQILVSFVETSYENLALFRNYLAEKNQESMGDLIHKILTMFRQLEADHVINALIKLESGGSNPLVDEDWYEQGKEALSRMEHFIDLICVEQGIVIR